MALDWVKTNGLPRNREVLRNEITPRAKIPEGKRFLEATRKHIREIAVFDLYAAIKGNFTKKRKNPGHAFEIKYKSRKVPTDSIGIPPNFLKVAWEGKRKKLIMFSRKDRLEIGFFDHSREKITSISHTCRLSRDCLEDYYLHIPVPNTEAPVDIQDENICALDPGVRTFHTLYDPCKGVVKFGHGDIKRIARLCYAVDRLQSARDKHKRAGAGQHQHKSKYTRRGRAFAKAMHRVIRRIRRLRDEIHWKFARYLIKNYKRVILPPFETSCMVLSNDRTIGSRTARNMLCWAHYTFRQRLAFKAKLHGTRIYIRDESYTSKTCCRCGTINKTLGGKEVFKCSRCGACYDRDVGGSLNIFLKHTRME